MKKNDIEKIFQKYNLNKKDRTIILNMVAEYNEAKRVSKQNNIKRLAAMLIIKKIWDYIEHICT